MNSLREWLKRIGPRIAIHFHGPVVFNLFAGKRGKDRGIPRLSSANPLPQAQRRQLLQINLAPSARERLLSQPASSRVRESWQEIARDIARKP
jgi:hypothetical protein